jgi:hypothetical protein
VHWFVLLGVSSIQLKLNRARAKQCYLISEFRLISPQQEIYGPDQIPINTTPEKVYSALTTQSGLRNWWTADTNAAERVGGKEESGFDRRGMIFRMKIEKLEPGKSVIWSCHGDHGEWVGTTLTWTIAGKVARQCSGSPTEVQTHR